MGCCLWGHTESDMTEVTQQQQPVCSLLGLSSHSALDVSCLYILNVIQQPFLLKPASLEVRNP